MSRYVHGYSETASGRLHEQAEALSRIVHDGTRYEDGDSVLEVGCGVGSQTAILSRNNPGIRITGIDISDASLEEARARLAPVADRVRFRKANAQELPFPDDCFDHAFLCFVLEHLAEPHAALGEIRRVTKPEGTITVVEGDHGSVLMHPDSDEARAAIACQVALQARAGGDAKIGRRLYPLLYENGFDRVEVTPRQVYTDGSVPGLAHAFTRQTFTAMIADVRGEAIGAGLIEPAVFDRGIAALDRAATWKGSFAYTFFKAVGRVPSEIGRAA